MRLSVAEKQEIIHLVDHSDLGVNRTLKQLGIHKSTFYNWYKAYLKKGVGGLASSNKTRRQWNAIPEEQRQLVVELALEHPVLSPRELAVKITDEQRIFISESSVYRILKAKGLVTTPAHILLSASNEFKDKPCFVHQLWQTDFTYFKILGWGWYYLSTVLDDYSRFIIHWELCKTMKAEDVQRTVDRALLIAGLNSYQKPRLLSDNGACYIASKLKDYLKTKGITQLHGKINHPQTQGKIERYHRSMKNVVKLDHYYCPDELSAALENFVLYYNHQRYHESLNNVTPADVYYGKREQILKQREKIKHQSLLQRRVIYHLEKSIV
jgi:transposase InsO family protein/transposase-like protein